MFARDCWKTALVGTFLFRGPVPSCQVAVRPRRVAEKAFSISSGLPQPRSENPVSSRTPSVSPEERHGPALAGFLTHFGRRPGGPSRVRVRTSHEIPMSNAPGKPAWSTTRLLFHCSIHSPHAQAPPSQSPSSCQSLERKHMRKLM